MRVLLAQTKWVDSYQHDPEVNNDYDRMIDKIDLSEFKRKQLTIGIKVSDVSFGIGRRMPVVKARREEKY